MKRQYGKITQRIVALMLGVLLTLGSVAQAAVNTAIGDVNSDPLALGDSLPFTLNTSTPTLIKTAFLTSDFSPLADNDVLPAGTSVDFLIYLNNEADVDIDDVGIIDALVGFTYVGGSLRVLNTTPECALTLCTTGPGSEEETIYNDARLAPAAVKTDAINDDEASESGGTIEVGNNVTLLNTQQNAVANTVLALVFTATID